MSNERADEFLSWRGRLAPPDALPDQGLDDRELSWERLAERLREKPRRRIGYWIAAACLLLALIPATHFFRDRPTRIVARHPSALPQPSRRQTLTDQTASRRSPATTTAGAPSVSRAPSVSPGTSSTLAPSLAATRPERTTITLSRLRAPGLPVIARLDNHPAIIAEPALLLSGDTITRMFAPRPAPRKQLRVVQINEINNSAGPAPAMTTRYPSPFHIGLGVPETGRSDDQVSQPDNASFLKIKLSSQNR